jgi:hypothetical protein
MLRSSSVQIRGDLGAILAQRSNAYLTAREAISIGFRRTSRNTGYALAFVVVRGVIVPGTPRKSAATRERPVFA